MSNRMLRDSDNDNIKLSNCSPFTQDFYKRLMLYSDDFGRFEVNFEIMILSCYKYEFKNIFNYDILNSFIELVGEKLIMLYIDISNIDIVYGSFLEWNQRLRIKKSKFPEPPIYDDFNDWVKSKYIKNHERVKLYANEGFKCSSCISNYNIKKIGINKLLRLVSDILKINYIEDKTDKLICSSCIQKIDYKININNFIDMKYNKNYDVLSVKDKTGDVKIENLELEFNKKDDEEKIPYEIIKNLYNKICPELSKILDITNKRRGNVNARWDYCIKKKMIPLDTFIEVFEKLACSSWHNGDNERNWKADFDWIINPNNFIKILEKPKSIYKKPEFVVSPEIKKVIEDCYKQTKGNCGAIRYGKTDQQNCKICLKLIKIKKQTSYNSINKNNNDEQIQKINYDNIKKLNEILN